MSQFYSLRPYAPADLDALVDLLNRFYADSGIEARSTPAIVQHRIDTPQFETALLVDAAGRMIGATFYVFDAEPGIGWGDVSIPTEHCTETAINTLLAYLEARTLTLGADRSAPDVPICLQSSVPATVSDIIARFDERGYRYVRSTYQMQVALAAPIAVPPLPDGIEIRPFDRAHDVKATYCAQDEAFAENWGQNRLDFETWSHLVLNRPGDDNSMWLIACAGDEIAGCSLNRPASANKPELAWVGSLGVLKPYRQRGLGSALLQHSFKLFQERGYTQAGLRVDASNATGAVALYERAGMRVQFQNNTYRKVLRGDEAQIKD